MAVALQALAAVSLLTVVVAARWLLDGLTSVDGGLAAVAAPAALLVGATAVSNAVGAVSAQAQRLLAEDAGAAVWRRILVAAGRVDLTTVETPGFQDRMHRLEGQALARPHAIAGAALSGVGGLASSVAVGFALLALSPVLLPLLIVAAVPAGLLARASAATEYGFVARWSQPFRARARLRRLVVGREPAAEVRALGAQPQLSARHDDLSLTYRRGLAAHVTRRQRYALAVGGTSALGLGVTVGGTLYLLDTGRLDLAAAGSAVVAARLLSAQVDRLVAALSTAAESAPFVEELDGFAPGRPQPPESGTRTADGGGAGVGSSSGRTGGSQLQSSLRLEGVRFRYPEGGEVLRGIDLTIHRGEVVALVGENGSGKTTTAKLLCGLYAPTGGTVRWDGRVLGEADRARLTAAISVVFQDFTRLDMTVRDNVVLGAEPRPDDAAVWHAVDEAGLGHVVRGLPRELDTVLGAVWDGAVDLSRGQWQRLALARALVRDSAVLVLDEPTSSLDPRIEHELYQDVRARAGGRAVLLVSHRYTNLHLADRVAVLSAGRVVETGSHASLLKAGGPYAELYRLQASAYDLDAGRRVVAAPGSSRRTPADR